MAQRSRGSEGHDRVCEVILKFGGRAGLPDQFEEGNGSKLVVGFRHQVVAIGHQEDKACVEPGSLVSLLKGMSLGNPFHIANREGEDVPGLILPMELRAAHRTIQPTGKKESVFLSSFCDIGQVDLDDCLCGQPERFISQGLREPLGTASLQERSVRHR